MINGIESIKDRDRIAIVVVGYNRKEGVARLLESLNDAVYEVKDVPLVISIDASGNQELYKYVEHFEWKHGEKFVNIQEKRLGLKNHIFQSISLCSYFKGVIILEDDLIVSPYFYYYAMATLSKYGDDENVAGIALYTNEYDGFNDLTLQHVSNGADVFAVQSVCSWGEMFNERMWNRFSEWMESFDDDFSDIDMIEDVKGWTRAWSKYMYAFMIRTGTFFIYPEFPLTTNFNDAGGEHGGGGGAVQVSLLQGCRSYQLPDFNQLVHYDTYWNNLSIAEWLGVNGSDLTVDFSGLRKKYYGRYVLSPFKLPYKRLRGFRLSMRPWELNIKYGIEGEDIILYDRENQEPEMAPNRKYTYDYLMYHLSRYQNNITPRFLLTKYYRGIKRRFGL